MAYTGATVKIPLGNFGLLTDMSPSSLPLGALIEARNVIINNGTVQKAPGSYRYNVNHPLDDEVHGLFDWFPTPFVQRLIALTKSGSIYKDTGNRTFNNATAITTGLTQISPRAQFVEAGNETAGRNKKLFLITDGANQIKVLEGDGSSFNDISLPASDWSTSNYPRCGVVHRNRLWLFSGQRAYASTTGDHEDFQGASILTQNIFPGEGGDVVGAFVFKGRLFTFKEGEFVYYLDDSDTNSTNWFWRKLASNFGLASPNAIVNALDDMLVGNSGGTVTSYRGADTLGDIESADIFRVAGMERYLRATTHPKGINEMHALYDEELKQVYFTYRSTYTNVNDMLINLDINRDGPRITYLEKGSPICLALYRGSDQLNRPIYGDKDGYINVMNYENRLEGSSSYTGAFQTAFNDFEEAQAGLGAQNKQFDFIWVEYVPEADVDLSIDVYIDGKFMETVTTKLSLYDDPQLNTLALGSARFGQYTTVSNPIPIHGMGRRISFRVYNSGSNESFQISSIEVGFRPTEHGVARF